MIDQDDLACGLFIIAVGLIFIFGGAILHAYSKGQL